MIELVSQIASDVEAWILALTSSWWVFVALFALCTIDGFFPPVPSESIVITLAVTAHTTGLPNIWLVSIHDRNHSRFDRLCQLRQRGAVAEEVETGSSPVEVERDDGGGGR